MPLPMCHDFVDLLGFGIAVHGLTDCVLGWRSRRPISMLASWLILREKYSFNQYLGALVVLGGILVVLFPVFTHRREANFHCQAIDEDNDCVVCQTETTKDRCMSHVTKHEPWMVVLAENRTNPDDFHCTWVSRELETKEEDFLVFVWSIVMVVSCVPMVLSSVYKQVALQVQLDPILVNGLVAVFQFICGLFMVVPAGLASSPRVHPLEMANNWGNAMQCLFARTNTIVSGCHPDDCSDAALWVHLGLASATIYTLSMMFVLKYGSCDLLYLGLTLVVPLGHLAFSLHSLAEISAFDVSGVLVIVAGLIMYRFGYADEQFDESNRTRSIGEAINGERPIGATGTESETSNLTAERPDMAKEGFLEFLREPFMLVGDI
jgi:CRT-like, chloroquine-resistance transporter-like